MLDGEPRRERPARAGAATAAAGHPPRPRAGPAAGVAVGPAVAHALDAAGAAARGAARARVPPGGRWEPVPKGPVGHRHAGQHAQPRRRDHHRRHHPASCLDRVAQVVEVVAKSQASFGSSLDMVEKEGRKEAREGGREEECFPWLSCVYTGRRRLARSTSCCWVGSRLWMERKRFGRVW